MDIVEMQGYGATIWSAVITDNRETLVSDFEAETGLIVNEVIYDGDGGYYEILASR